MQSLPLRVLRGYEEPGVSFYQVMNMTALNQLMVMVCQILPLTEICSGNFRYTHNICWKVEIATVQIGVQAPACNSPGTCKNGVN